MTVSKKIIFIVGPTASGKTAVSIQLAREWNAEIVSADSMQVYKGMDIGTAKPTPEETQSVPHHLLDIVEPGSSFSVFDYLTLAVKTIEEISQRGHLPIVCGGTGLYVRALLEGIHSGAGENSELREHLESRSETEGSSALHQELREKDPDAADRIDPNDLKRIIRALELWEHSRRGLASHKTKSLEELGYKSFVIGLTLDRQQLYDRINQRVETMFQQGLVDEVKELHASGMGKTALQAVGYKELISYLKNECSLEEAKAAIQQGSRRLAKRQMTWFKGEKVLEWVDLTGILESASAADRVRDTLERMHFFCD